MKRKGVAVLVLGLCGLGVLMYWLTAPALVEPEYNGKYYSEWLEQFVENTSGPKKDPIKVSEAREAMRQIGTNAVPTLIALVSHENSVAHQVVGSVVSSVTRQRTAWHTPEIKRKMALLGFSGLRSDPGPAVPALVELLSHERVEVSALAADALATIGPEARAAVPAMVEMLGEDAVKDPRIIVQTIRALGLIGADAETAVPLLVEYLGQERYNGQHWQAGLTAIGRFGESAAFAVPGLKSIAERTDNERLRKEIAETIQAISVKSSDAQPAAVETPEAGVR